jgi:hypothetical protein
LENRRKTMSQKRYYTLTSAFICGILILVTLTFAFARADGDSRHSALESRVEAGFALAPVHLNLTGKDRAMVGLGSYLVNAGGCDDCHSTGPQAQYVPGRNPYFGQPEAINPATYLGGGRSFGQLIPGSATIISRNLTPDKSGRPIGGASYAEFLHTLRTGEDPDHLHPTCTGAPNAGCIPHPFKGELLQIMPWPNFQHLTDHDIRAIYEYLSAVPCVQGNYPGEPADRCQ